MRLTHCRSSVGSQVFMCHKAVYNNRVMSRLVVQAVKHFLECRSNLITTNFIKAGNNRGVSQAIPLSQSRAVR